MNFLDKESMRTDMSDYFPYTKSIVLVLSHSCGITNSLYLYKIFKSCDQSSYLNDECWYSILNNSDTSQSPV